MRRDRDAMAGIGREEKRTVATPVLLGRNCSLEEEKEREGRGGGCVLLSRDRHMFFQ